MHSQLSIPFRRGEPKNSSIVAINNDNLIDISPWNLVIPQEIPIAEKKNMAIIPLYHRLWPLLCEYYADPLSSLTCSKTMLLPHQVEAATKVLESIRPRFLIADEVGLGKTIEAGLIIKELILKNDFKRVLICTPSTLLHQWKNELSDKYNEDFLIVTGSLLRKEPHLFQKHERILISVDLAKDDRYFPLINSIHWDIVVFDEAHRLRKDANKTTRAYQFAEKISKECTALLLLSATPFRGKLEELYYLVQLIDPDILGPLHTFINQYQSGNLDLRKKLSPVIIRRRKVDVGGFTNRFARTVKIQLSPSEEQFYNEVTEYVRREYNRAQNSGQRFRGFVMITFQKLLDSSVAALLKAFERRKTKLHGFLFHTSRDKVKTENAFLDLIDETQEDFGEWEEEHVDLEESFDPAEIRLELQSIEKILSMGRAITKDSKFEMLCKTIASMKKKGHRKFLIFTQFKSTLDFLANELKKRNFFVLTFHGSLTNSEKEKAVEDFFKQGEIFILTEAGGEGRNLQSASSLLNYDLPWSPLKIEQRIGRIHRYGQEKDVHVVNFACKNTVAERVLEVLGEKISLFEDALGESDTLLGLMEDDFNFSKNFMQFLSNQKTKREWNREIKLSLERAKANVSHLNNLLSPEFLDYNLKEFQKVMPQKNDHFRKELFELCSEYIGLEELPPLWKEVRKNKKTFYWKDRKGSFEQNVLNSAEYLAIGHELIDIMIKDILKRSSFNTIITYQTNRNSTLFHFSVSIQLDRQYHRNYSIEIDEKGNLLETKPLDLDPKLIQNEKEPFTTFLPAIKKALGHLNAMVKKDIRAIRSKLLPDAEMLRFNINDSHQARSNELDEKLEIQKGKSRWYSDKKMAGAITRTIHKRQNVDRNARKRLLEIGNLLKEKVTIEIKHLTRFIKNQP